MDIFPLMCAIDKVWITELTLIYKNIRSVHFSQVQELTLIPVGLAAIVAIMSVLTFKTAVILYYLVLATNLRAQHTELSITSQGGKQWILSQWVVRL